MAADTLKMSLLFGAVDKASDKMVAIQKASKKMTEALNASRKELSDLNKTQGTIRAFRDLKKEIGDNTRKFAEAQAKVKALAADMRGVEKPTQAMERAFAKAKKQAGEFKTKIDGQSASLEKLRRNLAEVGIAAKGKDDRGWLSRGQLDLNGKIADASSRVDSNKVAAANMRGTSAGTGGGKAGAGSVTDTAVKAGLIMGTLYELKDILAAPVLADAKAQTEMTNIGIKANLSREQLAAMRAEIDRLAPAVRKTSSEVRGGVDFLAASGLDPRSALKMMEPVARASHAHQAEITDVAQAANAALTNLKIPMGKGDVDRAKQTTRLLEIMAVAGNEGNFELKDMARHFPVLTARMNALKQQGVPAVADLSAALQVAWMATGDADKAATNIDNLLLKINMKETIKNFKDFGVDLPAEMKRAYAEGKSPMEKIAELTQKATGGDTDKIGFLFGDAQAQTGVLAMIQNLEKFRQIRDKTLSAGTSGQIDRDFERRAIDTASRWEGLMSRWESLKERIGGTFSSVSNFAIDSASAAMPQGVMDTLLFSPMLEAVIAANKMQADMRHALIGTGNMTRAESERIGHNVGDGISTGILSKSSRIRGAIESLSAMMPQWMKEKLDIHSPSRVFAAIGGHMMAGLAQGIDQSRAAPVASVGSAAVAAANAMKASASVGKGGGMAGNIAYNVTINLTGADASNPKGAAMAIKRELDALLAVEQRGAYDDG